MIMSVPFLIPRPTTDNDFSTLKEIAVVHETWQLNYDKNGIKIWSKALPDATIKMIKVWAIFTGFSSTVLYNTVMDNIYRKKWDSNYLMGYEIGYLNPNNAVSYYATSCPPLKSRDFVLQTSWLDKGSEKYILNHSICHKEHPPRPDFVRAVSYLTGYYLKSTPDNGCEMTFVSQTDPQGMVPAWIVNKLTLVFAPKYVRKIEQAANGYLAWKVENNPSYLPWLHPEQIKVPRISITDCIPSEEEKQSSFFRYLLEKELKMKIKNSIEAGSVAPGPSVGVIENYDLKVRQNMQTVAQIGSGSDILRKKGKRKRDSEVIDLCKYWKTVTLL